MSISAGELAEKLDGDEQSYPKAEQGIFAALENLESDASKFEKKLKKKDSDAETVISEAYEAYLEQPALEEGGSSDAETVVGENDDRDDAREAPLRERALIEEQQRRRVQEQKSESEQQEFERQQRIEGQGSRVSRLLWPVKKKSRKHKKTEDSNADEDSIESHRPKKPKIQEEENEISRAGYLASLLLSVEVPLLKPVPRRIDDGYAPLSILLSPQARSLGAPQALQARSLSSPWVRVGVPPVNDAQDLRRESDRESDREAEKRAIRSNSV